ncbi:MAG: 16S rRNA (guanine(527)-N(7))-methyltransferase RsmG [Ramlibacter sp.]
MTSGPALEQRLRQGLGQLKLSLDDRQVHQLLAYLALLQKWNGVYNLTAVRSPEAMLTQHLLDSLSAIPPLLRQAGAGALRLLDVGAGGGLPGVVVAICCPRIQVDCVDTVAKKAAFIQQVAAALPLANLRGLHSRVESLAEQYDVITSRAFASLPDFVACSQHALAPAGVWMAMKGKHPAAEIDGLPQRVSVFHVEQLLVPELEAERCLIWLRCVAGVT